MYLHELYYIILLLSTYYDRWCKVRILIKIKRTFVFALHGIITICCLFLKHCGETFEAKYY